MRLDGQYVKWVETLRDQFFCPGDGPILFSIDDDLVADLARVNALKSLPEVVQEQFPDQDSDRRWDDLADLTIADGTPASLPVLAIMVLARSRAGFAGVLASNYYMPFRSLVGPPGTGRPRGFEFLMSLWQAIPPWALRSTDRDFPLGDPVGDWDVNFYPARYHALLTYQNERRDLPEFFASVRLSNGTGLLLSGSPVDLPDEDPEWNRIYDQFAHWALASAQRSLRRAADPSRRDEVLLRIRGVYRSWDGSIPEPDGTGRVGALSLTYEGGGDEAVFGLAIPLSRHPPDSLLFEGQRLVGYDQDDHRLFEADGGLRPVVARHAAALAPLPVMVGDDKSRWSLAPQRVRAFGRLGHRWVWPGGDRTFWEGLMGPRDELIALGIPELDPVGANLTWGLRQGHGARGVDEARIEPDSDSRHAQIGVGEWLHTIPPTFEFRNARVQVVLRDLAGGEAERRVVTADQRLDVSSLALRAGEYELEAVQVTTGVVVKERFSLRSETYVCPHLHQLGVNRCLM